MTSTMSSRALRFVAPMVGLLLFGASEVSATDLDPGAVSLIVRHKEDGPVFAGGQKGVDHWRYKLLIEPIAEAKEDLINPFTIYLFRVAKEIRFNVEIIKSESGLSVAGSASQKEGEVVVVSGGFLASYSPVSPIGFTKINGNVEVNPVSPTRDDVLTGIVCFEGASVAILPMDTFIEKKRIFSDDESCLQAGPLMVRNRESYKPTDSASATLSRFSNRHYTRCFMTLDEDGTVYVGITTAAPLDLLSRALTETLAAEFNIGLTNAIHLHGSSNAGIVFRRGSEIVMAGSPYVPQATMIVGMVVPDAD